MKSSDGLNKEKGKTTEIWDKLVEIHRIKKKNLTSINWLSFRKKYSGIKTVIFKNLTESGKEFWLKTRDMQVKLGVKNLFDLVRNEIHGIFNTKNPTKEQIWNYKDLLWWLPLHYWRTCLKNNNSLQGINTESN